MNNSNFNFDPTASVFVPTSSFRYRSSTIDDFSSSNSKASTNTSCSSVGPESEINCDSEFSTKSEFSTMNSKSNVSNMNISISDSSIPPLIHASIHSPVQTIPQCSTTSFQTEIFQNKNSNLKTNSSVPIATATKIVSIVPLESESLKISRQKYELLEKDNKSMKLREIEHLKAFSYCQYRMTEQQRIIEKLQRENMILNRKFQSKPVQSFSENK